MTSPARERVKKEQPESLDAMATDTIIAKSGDVLFLLGKEGQVATKVRVSSMTLSLASPVFEALFKVPLLDDDMQSMLLICKIAHLQTAGLPDKVSVDDLANFAILCDKYQCKEAVQAWSQVWITKMLKAPSGIHLEKVVFASYVLDLPEEFYQATVALTRDQSADATIIAIDVLPAEIFNKLRASKRQTEQQGHVAFSEVTRSFGGCDSSRNALGLFVVSLRNAGIWPFKHQSISHLKTQVASMSEVPTTDCSAPYCPCRSRFRNLKGNLIAEMNTVYNSVNGICLDCIKRKAVGGSHVCRITHDATGRKTA
ncbi:hypothetical protein CC86DRAFT_467183 [Ophiobolus disseminans]|uniref:BTB domain-containing protein n=1 Tax=Ophiobolus disseminans TaxID=1469910 RepID=A0A6A7A1S5_9PLEO|nr:hypothetical protein CC86DRAFT_467183 [Ophiobolus disseminans]